MSPAVLNENLISRYKSLVASLYVEHPKKAEAGSSKSEKETDFSVELATKANVQTKNKRKLQEIKAEKITCKEKAITR